jgi:hypothetical protein
MRGKVKAGDSHHFSIREFNMHAASQASSSPAQAVGKKQSAEL